MPIDSFALVTTVPPNYGEADHQRMQSLSGTVPGAADHRHYSLFKHVFSLTGFRTVLVLNLRSARDACFMLDAAAQCGRRIAMTIVSPFEGPDAMRREDAEQSIVPCLHGASVRLITHDPDQYLSGTPDRVDLVYADLAPDFVASAERIARLSRPLRAGGLLVGSVVGNDTALRQVVPDHLVYAGSLWLAGPRQLPTP